VSAGPDYAPENGPTTKYKINNGYLLVIKLKNIQFTSGYLLVVFISTILKTLCTYLVFFICD